MSISPLEKLIELDKDSWGGIYTKRFWNRVNKTNYCWDWIGKTNLGYGRIYFVNRMEYAHRISFFLNRGFINEKLVINHKCENKRCVNPDHLEEITIGENVLLGNSTAAKNKRKTHCNYGHYFSKENTKIYRGNRICLKCVKRKNDFYNKLRRNY